MIGLGCVYGRPCVARSMMVLLPVLSARWGWDGIYMHTGRGRYLCRHCRWVDRPWCMRRVIGSILRFFAGSQH